MLLGSLCLILIPSQTVAVKSRTVQRAFAVSLMALFTAALAALLAVFRIKIPSYPFKLFV